MGQARSIIVLYVSVIILSVVHCCLSFVTLPCAAKVKRAQDKEKTHYHHHYHHHVVVGISLRSGGDSDQAGEDNAVLEEILQVAIDSAKKAGEIILQNSNGAEVVEKKSTSRDLLTLIDPQCEKVIRETILEVFPGHEFLGEEQVEPGINAAIAALEQKLSIPGYLWIVDPIDGTTNFASGIPLNMPSIAVAYNGEILVGVLYDPHRNELFTAMKGSGAFLNGERIFVGSQESLGEAVVGMESPAGKESMEQCLKGILPLMPKVRTVRMLGSSAVMLPWVANGRLTAYWTPDECAWDIAAGALILKEAGGRVTDLDGNDYTIRSRSLVGSNGKVHDALLNVLREEASLVSLY